MDDEQQEMSQECIREYDRDEVAITGKQFQCPHCHTDISNVQNAIWTHMITERLQYMNAITLSCIRQNLPVAEMLVSMFKSAYCLEEQRKKETVQSKKHPDKLISTIKIKLIKVPAIRANEKEWVTKQTR